MKSALNMARRGLGRVAPNPAVGCVIISRQGHIIARARTADGGRPHAETLALQQAGEQARGATAYVSLEPCAHEGKTGPCAAALIRARVARVVVACTDPDPRVSGRGIEMMRAAGIEVVTGVLEEEARQINAGFFLNLEQKRPFVTLKAATTLDGKIATNTGESKWITGAPARRRVHLERAMHDAILTGIGTVLADDPMLNARLDGYEHKGIRIVLDTHLRIPAEGKLARSAKGFPLWVFYKNGEAGKAADLQKLGVRLFQVTDMDVGAILPVLAENGVTRLMVEAGAQVMTSFLQAGLCDRFLWFRAPQVMGGDGKASVGSLSVEHIEQTYRLKRVSAESIDQDLLEIYSRCA